MRFLRRRQTDIGDIRPENILWGVPRREGYSDTDDPLVHEGLVQHAFVMGNDERALCGAEAPRRLSRADTVPRAQLALPGPANPRCRRCEAVLAEAARIITEATPVPQVAPAPSGEAAPAQPSQGGPVADATPRTSTWMPRAGEGSGAERLSPGAGGEPGAHAAEEDDEADEPHVSHPRGRVRRGGLVTIPAGRESVVAELPASAHGAAIAAEIDGVAGEVRVQSIELLDEGTLRITLNQETAEPVDVMWYVVSSRP
jgi:hypothetical protein